MLIQLFAAVAFALPNAEFARYHRQITGCEPAVGAVTFAVDSKVSNFGADAYTIKSDGEGVKITGSNERSVWYGLYDLLERRGGCHWFWDADVVPHRDSIDLSGLDVREEARFEYRGIRYFAHRGLTRFQAEHWGFADWKREIDWILKRRLNVFMLRIGQDDLFQRAFPETCAYPDPSKELPGHGKGYDNRSLFWSLRYRGKLRQDVQRYALERGLLVPEDFGTMTHWYSRTPQDFLDRMQPPFLPQTTTSYGQPSGRVWDIRDEKWADAYWHLTKTAVSAYNDPNPALLHTIGLGERSCFTNRADNFRLKTDTLGKFIGRAHTDYPDAKIMLAGWDFFFSWLPEEVRKFVGTLDPKREIIWDYEGDTDGDNNFTVWDVVGKFPYTFSIFLAFEDGLDARANYPRIEARQKLVQEDPYCRGYLLWPEASHTDILCLRYFTANAWSRTAVPIDKVLAEFCASRYGTDSERWQTLWRLALPMSYQLGWGSNYAKEILDHRKWQSLKNDRYNDGNFWTNERTFPEAVDGAHELFRGLATLDWKASVATERDAIDLARMAGDRVTIAARDRLLRAYHEWKGGRAKAEDVVRRAEDLKRLAVLMADVLALHTDYSLAESFDRLNAVCRVVNPDFPKVLMENASCNYCFSHQAEPARHWYAPAIAAFADDFICRVRADDRSALGPFPPVERFREDVFMRRSLESMRPTLPRTQETFQSLMMNLAREADGFSARR